MKIRRGLFCGPSGETAHRVQAWQTCRGEGKEVVTAWRAGRARGSDGEPHKGRREKTGHFQDRKTRDPHSGCVTAFARATELEGYQGVRCREAGDSQQSSSGSQEEAVAGNSRRVQTPRPGSRMEGKVTRVTGTTWAEFLRRAR